MKKRSILYSPRVEELKRKKRKVLKNRLIFLSFCFLILLTGLVFLSHWKTINIENIRISGNKIIETEAIENIIKEDIKGYYLWVFPKTNFILYPKNHIKNDLANKFKRFSKILINLDDTKTLNISVSEREGRYLWCGANIPALINDTAKCYFIDQMGYIFDEAPYFSGNVYFKFYGKDTLNIENPSGNYFLKDKFTQISFFIDGLQKLNLKPGAFYIDEKGDGNIALSFDLITGPKIIFKIDSDYEKIIENLEAAIKTEPLQTKIKNNLNSLLYIDLRFANNVYYKFK